MEEIKADDTAADSVGRIDPDDPEYSPTHYQIKLEVFEGPLDLLLHLIKKEEVSIYDIPIAGITERYLAYLRTMQDLDIAVAGEFLMMAATLIHIKSRMLLPRDPEASAEATDDPRSELVNRLLEHQKFKEAANALHQLGTIESGVFTRAAMDEDRSNPEVSATVFRLFEIFQHILQRREALTEIEIARDEMTMAEMIVEISELLSRSEELSARAVFERARSRRELVLTFLAILELVKDLRLRLRQDETFGDILLLRRDPAPSPAGAG